MMKKIRALTVTAAAVAVLAVSSPASAGARHGCVRVAGGGVVGVCAVTPHGVHHPIVVQPLLAR